MAIIDWPSGPTVGQLYTFNGITYTWTGTKWQTGTAPTTLTGPTGSTGLTGPTGPVVNDSIRAESLNVTSLGYHDVMVNGALEVSASASALTIALKTQDGGDPAADDPVEILFRNVTGTTGNYSKLAIAAAASLVISSGSTLGVTSSTAFRLWIVGFNDGGTFRLGAINCTPSAAATSGRPYPLVEGLASSTAEGGAGAADSAGVIYTGTAVSAKAMRVLGYIEWSSSGLTAGTWTTTNLLSVQLFGPGICMPGEVVQKFYTTDGTQRQATSTTPVQGVNQSISLTSAANLVRVATWGAGYMDTAGQSAIIRLRRDTTNIGQPLQVFSSAGGVVSSVYSAAWDKPNTTAATSYNATVELSDATGNGYYPFGSGSAPVTQLEVEEIMA